LWFSLIVMVHCDVNGYVILWISITVVLWKTKVDYVYVTLWRTSWVIYVKLLHSSRLCYIHKGLCCIGIYLNSYVGLQHYLMGMSHCNLNHSLLMLICYIPKWFCFTMMVINGYIVFLCSWSDMLDCNVH